MPYFFTPMLHHTVMSSSTSNSLCVTTHVKPRPEQLTTFVRLPFILQPVEEGGKDMKWRTSVVLRWVGIFNWVVFNHGGTRRRLA